jgi:hypothetical protein
MRRGASIYKSAAAGGAGGQRQLSTTNDVNPTKGMGLLWFPCGTAAGLKCQVFSEELAPLTSNFKLHTSNFIRAKRTQFRPPVEDVGRGRPTYKACETNPIWPGRAANAQNKAKLGWTGASRQRSSCWPWLGRRANVQNEPNLAPTAGAPEVKCAKRTQFPSWGRCWAQPALPRGGL